MDRSDAFRMNLKGIQFVTPEEAQNILQKNQLEDQERQKRREERKRMSTILYKQVKLSKNGQVDTAWIEERAAHVGATVELKLGENQRDPDWQVMEVYETTKTAEQVQEDAQHYKTHRKGTDI